MDNKVVYFNSKDNKSLKLFPSSRVSNFTQLIQGEINCVEQKFKTALQSIYILPQMKNKSSLYLHFKIEIAFQGKKIYGN